MRVNAAIFHQNPVVLFYAIPEISCEVTIARYVCGRVSQS
jgi:hypothetical protein